MNWFWGLAFSLLVGGIVVDFGLKHLRHVMGISKSSNRKAVPSWLVGVVERFFFTLLVGLGFQGVPAAMIGWLAVKMATNWNHKDHEGESDARTFAFTALLGGLISMTFALLAGSWIDLNQVGAD